MQFAKMLSGQAAGSLWQKH